MRGTSGVVEKGADAYEEDCDGGGGHATHDDGPKILRRLEKQNREESHRDDDDQQAVANLHGEEGLQEVVDVLKNLYFSYVFNSHFLYTLAVNRRKTVLAPN